MKSLLARDNSFGEILKLSSSLFHFPEIKEDVEMLIFSNLTFVSFVLLTSSFSLKRGKFSRIHDKRERENVVVHDNGNNYAKT